MISDKVIKEIKNILKEHDQRLAALEKQKTLSKKIKSTKWYQEGTTIEKIINLISNSFFNKPHNIREIIDELETQDFHFKPADLTLPLRKIVRKNLLKKTKKNADGSESKCWLYVKK